MDSKKTKQVGLLVILIIILAYMGMRMSEKEAVSEAPAETSQELAE